MVFSSVQSIFGFSSLVLKFLTIFQISEWMARAGAVCLLERVLSFVVGKSLK